MLKIALVVAFVLSIIGTTGVVVDSLVTHWGAKVGVSFIIMACVGLGYLLGYWDIRRKLS